MSNKDRYGNMFSIEFFETDTSVPMMMEVPHPGGPKGTDTVPAWLTPGENVVNAEASRLPGNQEMIDQMNEEGRMIQKAQGGPIPTYEADGGMVYASGGTKSNLPITTRVMPNGKIGLWRGNTYLGIKEEKPSVFKEISDSLKDSGWNPFKANGGAVPPMYSAAGDFVTNSLLDRIRRIESGGDPNATSEAGAMGQYQIMPATAAQPGYGVTPLAAKDIRDPAKSREFARQYLMGIAAANPDFTEDEVITAYHSGAGNVRKAKEGTKALGPRGQAYADKVNNAGGVGPDAFGVTRRQVTTVPPISAPIDFSQYSDPLTGPRVPTQIAGSEDQRIRDEAILEESMAAKRNNISAMDDAGLTVPVILEKEIPIGQIDPYTGEEIVVDSTDLSGAAIPQSKEEYDQLKAAIDKPTEVPEVKEPPKPENDEAAAAKIKAAEAAAKANKDAADVKDNNKDITGAGTDLLTEDPTFAEEIKQGFIDMFGEMFNPKELARMVVNYAGSRALGYDHGASLKYSAQTYVKTLAAQQKQYQADIRGKDYQDFTEASRKEFEKTRDYSVLKKKSEAIGVESEQGQMYLSGVDLGNGKMFSGILPKVKLSDDTEAFVFPDGSRIRLDDSRVRGKYSKAKDKLHDRVVVSDKFLNSLELSLKRHTTGLEEKDKIFASQEVADAATNLLFKQYERHGADPAKQTALYQTMNKAVDKWAKANADWVKNGRKEGRDPYNNLEAFFNSERIIYDFNISPKDLKGTDPYNMAQLLNDVNYYSDEKKDDAKRDWRESNEIFNKGIKAKNNRKYGWDAEPPEGYTKFTWWLRNAYDDNPNAIKFLNETVAKKE